MCDGESTDYGATSEAARKDTKKLKKTRSLRMNGSQNALVVIMCAHAYLCIQTRTKSGTTTRKRGGLDKRWVHFKAKNSTVGAMCGFVLFLDL